MHLNIKKTYWLECLNGALDWRDCGGMNHEFVKGVCLMCELMNEPSVLKIDFTVQMQHVVSLVYSTTHIMRTLHVVPFMNQSNAELQIVENCICRELQKPNEINEIAKNKKK